MKERAWGKWWGELDSRKGCSGEARGEFGFETFGGGSESVKLEVRGGRA